jgi:RNA polymerase sigma-70 factor, ECF subfamily
VTVEETDLINECQQGSKEAFGFLYDLYLDKIYRFVYYKVMNKESAEDITSDVFLKAFSRIGTYDASKANFSTWIYSIARNAVIDHYRSKKQMDDIDDYFDLAEDANIERTIDAKDKLRQVSKYLKTLSPSQREVVILRVWQGMPYKEIAEVLGKTEAGVKMSFSRAVKDLKDKFGPLVLAVLILLRPW